MLALYVCVKLNLQIKLLIGRIKMITKQQKHLNYKERINLGSYYTNTEHVSRAWNFVNPYIDSDFIILDSSCGYGNFL